ncbi:MAG: SpoIIE family protein phosphatase [Thermodesulfobacteriota bacterium]
MKSVRDVTILFVDDEPEQLSSLQRFLRKEPYRILFAQGGQEALALFGKEAIDIIVTDLRMPEMDGMALLAWVKERYPQVLRLILSATQDVLEAIEAINKGEVYRFFAKPIDPEPFRRILLEVVDYHLLVSERQAMMAEIQRQMLQVPPPLHLEGAQLAASMLPAGQLNGDFADYFVFADGQVDILVGDVMGKGVMSALVAAGLRQKFAKSLAECGARRQQVGVSEGGGNAFDLAATSEVMASVHGDCIDNLQDLEMFVTLSYARLDLVGGRLGLVDCGHMPVIHFQGEKGSGVLLKGNDLALGMASEQEYRIVEATLSPGDTLLFYTDGVTEAAGGDGEIFGEERLLELVEKRHHLDLPDLLATIRAEVTAFSGLADFADDFTCIAVRIGEF